MDVIVIGGGLVGVTTAYELLQRGHRTTIVEARSAVALETSYANGALLTPSMADPWNAPGVHRHLVASLFDRKSAMKLRMSAMPSLVGWGYQFLKHSKPARHEAATKASYLLAKYSLARLGKLNASLSLRYDASRVGTLKVFRTQTAMRGSVAVATKLQPLGLRFDVLDADATIAVEPTLAGIREQLAGAIRFPDDESGDALLFCEDLTAKYIQSGGAIRLGTHVDGIAVDGGVASGISVDNRVERAEAVVVAAGNFSARLVRRFGISLPIRPAKGYSLTFDASHVKQKPSMPIIDDALHAAIVPIGTRLRVAGTAEFAGNDHHLSQDRIDNLFDLLGAVLPGIASQLPRTSAQPWTGLRPMSADGLPFIGLTPVRGLYVNAGHGHLGWTLAAGSAHLLAEVMEDRRPDIDPTPYRMSR